MVSLLESLEERFPPQEIHEFGKCLIIPIREFPDAYGERLKSQGYRIRYQGFGGRSCAFVLLNRGNGGNGEGQKAGPQAEAPASSGQKESPKVQRPWTDQDVSSLKELYTQGVSVEEIARKLSRSETSIKRKCERLALKRGKKQADPTEGPLPGSTSESTPEVSADSAPDQPEPVADKQATHNGGLVKELLEASSVLYPHYRHAAALVLQAAAKEMERDEA
jgi:hypothetical protein